MRPALGTVWILTSLGAPACSQASHIPRRESEIRLPGPLAQPGMSQPVAAADTSFRYRIAATVPGPSEDSTFLSVTAVAADSLGHLFIADRDGLHLADTTGRYLVRIARRGRGPGEVSWVAGLVGLRGGGVWALDYANRRYSRFAADGRFLTSQPRALSPYFVPWPGGSWEDGFIDFDRQGGAGGMQAVAVTTDSGWSHRKRLPLPVVNELHVPFAPSFVFRSGPGGIWFGVSGRYRLYGIALTGDTLRILSHTRASQPVSKADREDALAGWKSRMGQMPGAAGRVTSPTLPPIPTRKPFFRSLIPLADDGVGVVPIVRPADQDRVIDLFDRTGRFRGVAQLPYPLVQGVTAVALGQRLLAALELPDGSQRVYVLRLEH